MKLATKLVIWRWWTAKLICLLYAPVGCCLSTSSASFHDTRKRRHTRSAIRSASAGRGTPVSTTLPVLKISAATVRIFDMLIDCAAVVVASRNGNLIITAWNFCGAYSVLIPCRANCKNSWSKRDRLQYWKETAVLNRKHFSFIIRAKSKYNKWKIRVKF